MPVEIKEMNVKVNVQNAERKRAQLTQDRPMPEADKEAVIAECIERILELLNQQKEP